MNLETGHGAFVDTTAIVGFSVAPDPHFDAASREFARLLAEGTRLVTSTDVFDETVTRVMRRAGHRTAVLVGESLRRNSYMEVIAVNETLRAAAWGSFVRYRDSGLSFTDCTSIAVARAHGLTRMFSFDAGFARVGFTLLPQAV